MDSIQIQTGQGKSISATGTTASTSVGAVPASRGWVVVADGGTAFVNAGASDVEATTSDLPCLDGAYVPIRIPEGATHVAAITAGASVTVRLYPLQGMRT